MVLTNDIFAFRSAVPAKKTYHVYKSAGVQVFAITGSYGDEQHEYGDAMAESYGWIGTFRVIERSVSGIALSSRI